MFSLNDVLKVRAGERMGSAINAGESLVVLLMNVFAMKSKNKTFKTVAWIITIIEAIDKIRLIFVNLRARRACIELIDEDEQKDAKEETSFKGMLGEARSNMKYQFTGKID